MKTSTGHTPHPAPERTARVHAFWDELKRHEAKCRLDDVKISALPDLAGRLMVGRPISRCDFASPSTSSAPTSSALWPDLSKFLDEIDAAAPAISGVAVQRRSGKRAPTIPQ